MNSLAPSVVPYYRAAGWTIRSNRALPYLLKAVKSSGPHDIEIRFAPISEIPALPIATLGSIRIFSPTLMDFANGMGARARITDGRLITIDVAPDSSDAEIHTSLFGPIFGLLCHQRGQPPLHAGAVAIGADAIAIAGDSGVGKSTAIRALLARGHRLLTDDQLIVDANSRMAQPSFPSNKLWTDSASWLGETTDPAHRVVRNVAKFHTQTVGEFLDVPAKLGVIFVLVRPVDRAEFRLLPVPEAVATLDRMIVRTDAAIALGTKPSIFRWAARLAATVPVYIVQRSDDPAQLGHLIDSVLEKAANHGMRAAEPVL